jgi:predicted enzyme related to lactoylglutathione lyase
MEITNAKFVLQAQEMWRAVAFWRDAFGLQVRFGDDEWTELALGDRALLVLRTGHDGSYRVSGFSMNVDDMAAAIESVRAAGGRVVREPHHPKGRTFQLATVTDTEGNSFRISQGA